MNKVERHDAILRLASQRSLLSADAAGRETGASPATIRRDFDELARRGSVERVCGGIRADRREGNVPFNMRAVQHSAEKAAIARRAVALLAPGDVLFVDGGTTTYHISLCLPRIPLRIITNSLRLSAELDNPATRYREWEIYLTGGCIQHGSSMLTGPGTVHSLDFYHAAWAFLSVGGISADGLYNTSEAIAATERKMIERADRAVILADQSKLGRRAMCRVAAIRDIHALITNPHPGRSLVEEDLERTGCHILRA